MRDFFMSIYEKPLYLICGILITYRKLKIDIFILILVHIIKYYYIVSITSDYFCNVIIGTGIL